MLNMSEQKPSSADDGRLSAFKANLQINIAAILRPLCAEDAALVLILSDDRYCMCHYTLRAT
jgi:hypothetical protein